MTDTRHLDGLASLRDGRWTEARSRRPRRLRLDADDVGVTVEIPAPRVLVEVLDLFLGVEVYRRGSGLVSRPRGSTATADALQVVDFAEEARRLVDLFDGLPDREDAGRPYRDLRTLSRVSPDLAGAYALDVLRALRSTLSTAPRPPRDARGETPARDRKSASRKRLREDEETSARWWLEGYLSGWGDEDEAPIAGTRVAAPDLYGWARERLEEVVDEREEILSPFPPVGPPRPTGDAEKDAHNARDYAAAVRARGTHADRLEEWDEVADDEDLPLRPRVLSSARFYGVADSTEFLGPRSPRSTGGLRFYTIPDTRGGTVPNKITDEEFEAALRISEIVDRLRDHKARHTATRDAAGRFAAATGTDGVVVDLDERRRSR